MKKYETKTINQRYRCQKFGHMWFMLWKTHDKFTPQRRKKSSVLNKMNINPLISKKKLIKQLEKDRKRQKQKQDEAKTDEKLKVELFKRIETKIKCSFETGVDDLLSH